MFRERDGIAFGVSSGPDKPSELYLWADNQTDKALSLPFCTQLAATQNGLCLLSN
jgi:hypothetical protein